MKIFVNAGLYKVVTGTAALGVQRPLLCEKGLFGSRYRSRPSLSWNITSINRAKLLSAAAGWAASNQTTTTTRHWRDLLMRLLVAVLTVLLTTSSIAVEIEMPGADCACSFVDIGLNNGDTLFQWPHTVLEEAHKNGLSNASAFGEVSAKLKHCLDPSMRRKSCFYGFELSPELTPILRKLDKSIKAGKFGNGVRQGYSLRPRSG